MTSYFGFSDLEILSFLSHKTYFGTDYYDVIQREQTKLWAQQVYGHPSIQANGLRVKEGISHAKLGKHGLAMDCYKRALKTDPTNADAYVARGASYFKTKYVLMVFSDLIGLTTSVCSWKLSKILNQP